MTVVERLAELQALVDEVKATECRHCGHGFIDHVISLERCFFPRVRGEGSERPCRCRGFADPALIEGNTQLELDQQSTGGK